MSVKLPPQVELIRLGRRKALSFTSSSRGPAITPQTWAFFPKAIRSGITPKCSQHQFRPVAPMPHCTSSKIRSISFSSQIRRRVCSHSPRKWLSPPSPWIGSMMIAAMSMPRSCDELHDLRFGFLFPRDHVALRARIPANEKSMNGVETRGQSNLANKSVLHRIGIRQAHGVAAATVKGVAEMQDLRAAFAAAGRHVFAHLPIHRGFERVLDRERAAFDEEHALERRQPHHAPESFDEPRVAFRVNIGVGDLDLGRAQQDRPSPPACRNADG